MKFKSLILSVLTILLIGFNAILPISSFPIAQAAGASTVTLTLSPNSSVAGGSVTASGAAGANTWVSIKILDNTQSVVFYDAVKSNAGGNYSDAFIVPSVTPQTLTVVAGYGSEVAVAGLNITSDSQPTWPSGSSLTATDISQSGLTLTWTAARDNVAVTGYKIYQGTTLLGVVNSSTFTYSVTGLSSGAPYTFRVEAGDAAGSWSSGGPSVSLNTAVSINTSAITVGSSNKNLAITPETLALAAPVTVTVPGNISNATLSVSSLLNTPVSGTVTTEALPALHIAANTALSSSPVQVEIPAGITISAEAGWKGTINLPRVIGNSQVAVTADAGKTAEVNAAIEVGFGDISLALSKPVRILIPGQAGREVGYVRGGTFTKITSLLTQDSGDSLASGGDGYINKGSDLVIWTRHFTQFVAYTQTNVNNGGGGSGGGSDTQAPQWPAGDSLNVTKDSGVVHLAWDPAADNVGVTGYKIYQGADTSGTLLATVSAGTHQYSYTEPGTGSATETFCVAARDAAGNWSTPLTGSLATGQSSLNFDPGQSRVVTVRGSSVTAAGPIAGSSTVPVNPTIMLYFNRGVTNESVWSNNKSCITLRDSSGAQVPINVFWVENQPGTTYVHDIFFTPESNLTAGETYTITISKNLKANNGNTLGESNGNLDKNVTFTVDDKGTVVSPSTPSTGGSGTTAIPPSTATTVAIGGDNTTYNQAALAALAQATSQQIQHAQLPDNGSAVSPGATDSVILTTTDGVQITVPPGSINQTAPQHMTVAMGGITTPPIGEKTAVVLNPLKYQRQFGAAGQEEGTVQFASPVTIAFPVSAEDLPAGITLQQLAVYGWNSPRNDWVKLGGVYDSGSKTISLPTYHFSTYAVMADTSTAPNRLAGIDCFETAIAVAEQGWKAGADNVVLANAYSFPDALAAGPLAYKLSAPILLTDADRLTPATLAEIENLAPRTITLIGGTAVISQAIQDSLSETYGQENILRYGGADRYETAELIASALGTTGKAIIVNGEDGHYTDALAVSSYAAYNGIPILFTKTSELPAATAQALTERKVQATTVAGGEAVVPAAVYNQLPGATRYGGVDRYATATTIAAGLHLNLNRVYLVTGLNFPDALVAGNLAAQTLSPIVMVDTQMPTATADFFLNNQGVIGELISVGGEAVITPAQDNALRSVIQPSH